MRREMPPTTEPGRAASALVTGLYWACDQATAALPGIGSAEDLAERHLARRAGSVKPAIDDLIAWQVPYAGAAEFVTNLGGLVTLPVTIPANLASVLLIQLRMITAIAILRGYQPDNPRVRTLAFLCLTGSAAADVLQGLSVGLGTRLSTRLIVRLSGGALGNIKQAVGARLAARMGAGGLIGLGRWSAAQNPSARALRHCGDRLPHNKPARAMAAVAERHAAWFGTGHQPRCKAAA